jgi:PST family polysaccharide transporter
LEAAALVWGMLAGSLVWTATQWALTRFRPDFSFDLGIVRSMVSYGSGAALLELLAIVAGRADAIVVGRVLGERALGLYTVAFRLPEALIDSISWNMSAVAFPALARKRAQEREGLAGVTLRLVRFQALYALPVAAGLAVLAPPLVVTMFGEAWREAGGVLAAVAIMSGVHAIAFPLGDAFKAVGRQRLLAGIVALQLPLMIGAIVLAAPAGILVVAWVRAAATILHSGIIVAASGPVLGVRSLRVFQATVPAMAAAAGVAAGAGMVRLAWPALSAGPVVLGALAGAAGGALALRYVVPGTLGDMARQVRLMRGAAQDRVPSPAPSS